MQVRGVWQCVTAWNALVATTLTEPLSYSSLNTWRHPQQTSILNRQASSIHRSRHTSIPFKPPLRLPITDITDITDVTDITDITDTLDADHGPRACKAPQNL